MAEQTPIPVTDDVTQEALDALERERERRVEEARQEIEAANRAYRRRLQRLVRHAGTAADVPTDYEYNPQLRRWEPTETDDDEETDR